MTLLGAPAQERAGSREPLGARSISAAAASPHTAVTAGHNCRQEMNRKYRFMYVPNCCFKFCSTGVKRKCAWRGRMAADEWLRAPWAGTSRECTLCCGRYCRRTPQYPSHLVTLVVGALRRLGHLAGQPSAQPCGPSDAGNPLQMSGPSPKGQSLQAMLQSWSTCVGLPVACTARHGLPAGSPPGCNCLRKFCVMPADGCAPQLQQGRPCRSCSLQAAGRRWKASAKSFSVQDLVPKGGHVPVM